MATIVGSVFLPPVQFGLFNIANFMDFVKPEEKQILIDSLKVNYKQIGDGNIPIILLHGWGVNSDKYTETLKQLVIHDSRFMIHAPDLPGFGKSDNPSEAWGVDNYVEFVRGFIQAIQGQSLESKDCPWIMIGHSFGGRIAIKFAAKYPEKLKALILTGAAGIKHPLSAKQRLLYALAKAGKAIFSLPLINHLEKPAKWLLYKLAREKDYYDAKGLMKETFKKIIDEDLTPCLDKISAHGGSLPAGRRGASGGKTPTLLLWGADDRSTPLADARLMNQKISDSELKIIAEANHSLPYQKPEEFAKIAMEFLKNKAM